MNYTVISAFRDAMGHIDRYCLQMDALQKALLKRGDTLSLLLGYGDSTDATHAMLHEECVYRFDALLVDVSHGGPKFGSVVHPQRFRQLGHVGNKLLDHVPDGADAVGIVESDLFWDAPTMLALLDHLAAVPAISAMVMDGPTSYYDTYASRKDGIRFTKQPPYHPALATHEGGLMQMDSAGSVLWMRGGLARQCRLTEDEVIVGLCKDIYAHGGGVWLDPQLVVRHAA